MGSREMVEHETQYTSRDPSTCRPAKISGRAFGTNLILPAN